MLLGSDYKLRNKRFVLVSFFYLGPFSFLLGLFKFIWVSLVLLVFALFNLGSFCYTWYRFVLLPTGGVKIFHYLSSTCLW